MKADVDGLMARSESLVEDAEIDLKSISRLQVRVILGLAKSKMKLVGDSGPRGSATRRCGLGCLMKMKQQICRSESKSVDLNSKGDVS